jgi:hypothetical protein
VPSIHVATEGVFVNGNSQQFSAEQSGAALPGGDRYREHLSDEQVDAIFDHIIHETEAERRGGERFTGTPRRFDTEEEIWAATRRHGKLDDKSVE